MLVSIFPLVPLVVVLAQFLVSVEHDIQFNAKERIGLNYNLPLIGFLEAVHYHLLYSNLYLAGIDADATRVFEQQAEVARWMAEVDAADARYGETLNARAGWSGLKTAWLEVANSTLTSTFADNLTRHLAFMDGVLGLITKVGNQSNLILDPDLDTYWLMDIQIEKLPQIADTLAGIAGYGTRVAANLGNAPQAQTQLMIQRETYRSTLVGALTSLLYSMDYNPEVRDRLQASIRAQFDAFTDLLRLLNQPSTALTIPAFESAISAAIHATYQLYDDVNPVQNDLIQRRVTGYETARNLVLVITAVALAALVYLFIGFYLAVKGAIADLEAASRRMIRGEMEQELVLDNQDELAQVAISFNNIANEMIAARQRAERSDQVKSAFLASMSHELRTPLNSVLNFTKFVLKGMMGPVTERQAEALGKVMNSGKHLLALINDVLDMSKIESGSLTLFVEDGVSIPELIESVSDTASSLLENKPVALRVEIEPGLPPIIGDRQRILQVFLNVVSNACKFTDEGAIHLRAYQCVEPTGDTVRVTVTDTGTGIAPEDAASVFEAFRQTKSGLRQGGGTGLGMPIAKNLVEAHEGKIWFESEVGKGTTFYVTLPVKPQTLVPVTV